MKEENILFGNAHILFTVIWQLVKDHSDSERETPAATTTWATLSD